MRHLAVLFTGLTIAVLLAGCATGANRTTAVPAWVRTTPPASGGYTYFVGSGSDTSGNLAAANENAVHSIVGDITRFLGVTIDSQTTVETKADLKSFQTKVEESIQERSTATVSDFSIVDRWIQRQGGQVSVFLLGKYRTAALEAERARLRAAERERTDAVAIPERAGDTLLAEDQGFAAAVKYLQAAFAATGPGITNPTVTFERTVKKAGEALSTISLTARRDQLTGMVGQAFAQPFLIEVTASGHGRSVPLANVPFTVTYPILRSNGREGVRSMRLESDAHGRLTINLPAPELIGSHTVTATVDLAPEVTPLLKAPERALVAALEQQVNRLRITLHYTTSSRARSIPTGVFVLDLDRAGNLMNADDAATGIVTALSGAGFQVLAVPPSPSAVGRSYSAIAKELEATYGDSIKRAVIGTARISSFEQSGGSFIVKVTGEVEVLDLATGKILFSTDQLKLSRASDVSSAVSAAFKDLGTSIGDEIRNRLP